MKKIMLLTLFVATALISGLVCAQPYPVKSVRLVVPFVAGGPTDIQTRMFAEKLTQRLGQNFVVDNRGGANGNIGMEIVARAPADGYTLIQASSASWAVSPSLYKLNYDVVKDFALIIQPLSAPTVLVVHPSVAATNIKELVALAKTKPGALNYGSSGVGGIGHISAETFCLVTGTKMTHIPFKSAAPALIALLGKEIDILFNNTIATVPFIKSGQARALGVTSLKRLSALPDVPTIDESGVKGFQHASWTAMAAPAGTPKEIINKLNAEMNQILKLPDIQEKAAAGGAEIVGGTPAQAEAFLKSELARSRRLVTEANLKFD